jgi:hypothetical protein
MYWSYNRNFKLMPMTHKEDSENNNVILTFIFPEIYLRSGGNQKNDYRMSVLREKDGFGGLVVSMLASGTQVRGFKPGRRCWIFTGVKILSMPSSGGAVKESVPALWHVKEPSNLCELQIAS